jgi:hypothetical protein
LVVFLTGGFGTKPKIKRRIEMVKLLARLVACFTLLAAAAWAQQTGGTISGTVRDNSGGVIPGVAVAATNAATGVTNTVSTNSAGSYSFLSLPVGTYNIDARLTGFNDFRQTNLVLNVNDALRVDITLEVGAVTTTVEVSAAAAHVETNNATVGQVIESKTIVDQPLVNRSYVDLMGLQAGVNVSTGTGTVSGDLSAGNVSVSGGRTDANGFTVNGGNVEEEEGNGTSIIPNADSIAEFKIITNSANAEYGHFSGGAVSVITKSGSNSFHGDGFEFWRNQDFDAITPFASTKGPYNHNQYGGTLGGPIKKNKLFFFGDWQGNRETTGVLETTQVPTGAELTGDLSMRAGEGDFVDGNGNPTTVSSMAFATQLTSQFGYPVHVGEQYYTAACTSTAQCVFPNGFVNPHGWASPTVQLLKLIPGTTTTVSGIPEWQSSAFSSLVHDNKGSGRIDATTGLGQLSFYYFIDNSSTLNPFGAGSVPGFATETPARAQQINIGDTKTFGANAVNDLKLNYTRTHHFSGEAIGGIGPTFSSLGFVSGGNGLDPVDPAFEGVPQFDTNEFSAGESGGQTKQTDNTFQFSEAYSVIRGTHQLKFGAEANYVQVIERRITDPNGAFDFTGNETGDDLADFLIGAVSTFTQSSNQLLDSRAWYYGVFAQDTWRIKPSFTLNYGLRQDVSTFFYDTGNKIQAIVPGLASTIFPGSPTGWVFPGDPGIPRTLAPTHYNNFAPRVAMAYSPNATDGLLGKIFGPSGHTAIRAAWGIFYTVVDDSTLFDEVADAPFGLYWQQNNVNFATPWVQMNGTVSGQHFATPFMPPTAGTAVNWSFFEPIASSPGVDINDRLPYTEEYNFTIERQIGSSTVANVAYVGSQGHRLAAAVESNPGIPSVCTFLSNSANLAVGSNKCGDGNENDTFTLADGATVYGTRAPLGINFSEGDQLWETVGRSTFNSLQATLRHTGKRYTLLAAYTWEKSMDTGSSNGAALDPLPNPLPAAITSASQIPSTLFTPTPATVTTFGAPDFNLFRALSSFDTPQDFVVSYTVLIPFDKLTALPSRLTNGWTVTGTTRFATGTPIHTTYANDNSYIGAFSDDFPNFNGGNLSHLNLRSSSNPKHYWIACPTSKVCSSDFSYSAEPNGQIGNAMPYLVIGPGINNTDLSLAKSVTITGERQLQFRLDAFNVFNHTQFSAPSGSETSSSFFRVTSARAARIAQLGVKFVF